MMMSIALRFIPILIEETDKIMKAQMARGADFENGSLIKRAKAMVQYLFRYLCQPSEEPMSLQWLWKQDVITVQRVGQR